MYMKLMAVVCARTVAVCVAMVIILGRWWRLLFRGFAVAVPVVAVAVRFVFARLGCFHVFWRCMRVPMVCFWGFMMMCFGLLVVCFGFVAVTVVFLGRSFFGFMCVVFIFVHVAIDLHHEEPQSGQHQDAIGRGTEPLE